MQVLLYQLLLLTSILIYENFRGRTSGGASCYVRALVGVDCLSRLLFININYLFF